MASLFFLLVLDPAQRKLRLRLAMIMYAAIVVMGSIPGARAEIGQFASGLALHSIAYAVLTALVFTGSDGSPARRALKAVLAVALMGAGDELVQSMFPYRGAAVSDWLVDCGAAAVTAAALWAWLPDPAPPR